MTWTSTSALRPSAALLLALALIPALFPCVHAQQPASDPQTVEEALHQMSDAAGIVFG